MPRVRTYQTKRSRLCDEIRGRISYGMVVSHIGTQKALAEMARIDPSTLSRHMRDIEKMSIGELLNICEQTGLTLEIRGKGNDI